LLHLEINSQSSEPVYLQIVRQIRQLIYDGLLDPGARLPSMRQLAGQLGVSLNTVHAACDALAAENLVTTRQGGGTFVTQHPGVATGTNLRTRAELGGANGSMGIAWNNYAFSSDFFMTPRNVTGADLINLARASPDPALYPFDRIKQTVSNMLWNPEELFFDRGHPQGYLPLVEHLEKEMALAGVPMAEGENDILLTSGFQRALSVLLHLLVPPGKKVLIESPTYTAILNLLLAERIPYEAIPMDAEGMDTDHLARVLEQGGTAVIVTIPTYHNPTGVTMSVARRQHLLALAAKHNVPIIEDDWGRTLCYDGAAPPPLKAMDPSNYVIQIGTYSKCFLPGLRIGWITCPSSLAVTLCRAKLGADQGDSFFLQALMYEFIHRGHLTRHIRHTVAEYRKRRNVMCKLLATELPEGCEFTTPAGGFSVWVTLPANLKSLPLLNQARKAGVEFLPAAYCMPDRQDASALRLAFSRASVEEIERGIPIFCQVVADNLKGLEG
jgi:DNA-binding transcriptional MocR family regulator